MTQLANDGSQDGKAAMEAPPVVSAEAWEAARQQLLVKEKAKTRARDALAAERRRMPWMAVGQGLCFRGAGRQGQPARPVRGPPAADRLPRLLRAGRVRLARTCLPRLLDGGRPGRPRRPSQRPRHHPGLRLARAAGRHRAGEGTDGLDDAVVHPHRRLRCRLRRRRVAWHQRLLSATARACSAPISSTTAATSRWAAPGTTSTSPPLGRQEVWEDSPAGYPQTPTYKWWNWHDSYVADAEPDKKWVEVSDVGEAAFRNRGADTPG